MAPTQLSAHVLSTLPFPSPPSWLITFCVTSAFTFLLSLVSCLAQSLSLPLICCIPVHIHFFISLLFQLYIAPLCHFLAFTLPLTSCCSCILPTLTTLLHSNIPLWSSNSGHGPTPLHLYASFHFLPLWFLRSPTPAHAVKAQLLYPPIHLHVMSAGNSCIPRTI